MSPSMLPKLQQPKSMISGTICSVLRRVRLRATNFHRARTAWLIISSEPTTKLAYGEDVWSRILKYQVLLEAVGRLRRMELMNIDDTLDGWSASTSGHS